MLGRRHGCKPAQAHVGIHLVPTSIQNKLDLGMFAGNSLHLAIIFCKLVHLVNF